MRHAPSFSVYLQRSLAVLEHLADEQLVRAIDQAIACIVAELQQQKPLLVCGNGGSASDAAHITAELVGRFVQHRAALPVYCLNCNSALLTAWCNDRDPRTLFARQLEAYAQSGAVLWAISTSGKSENVIASAHMARSLDVPVIALSGGDGGDLCSLADVAIIVPARETALIQQAHQCIYHYMCARIEDALARPSALDSKN